MAGSAAAVDEFVLKAEQLTARVEAVRSEASSKSWRTRDNDDEEKEEDDDDANYFQLKQEMLLQYSTDLAFYLLLKSRGESTADHDVVKRLFEMRLVMEKMRPLEAKLRHQLDKVLQRGTEAESVVSTRPNPRALNKQDERPSSEVVEDSGTYRAPKHSAVVPTGQELEDNYVESEEDEEEEEAPRSSNISSMKPPSALAASRQKVVKERKTRLRRSEMRRLLEANDSQPERLGTDGLGQDDRSGGIGKRGAHRERLGVEAKEREKFEEDRFMRVDTNKKAKKRRKQHDQFTSSVDDLI